MNPCDLSLCEAASRIRNGEISAEAYAAAMLARCEALKTLNAFITLDVERVLAEARRADRRREDGEPLGPLHGIPIAIKDNIDVAGYPTTAGTPALCDHRPNRTAPIVQALLNAGAIVLGKTNMHELAYGLTSNNPTFGAVHNPYDRNRSAGGSSGGTAAAVAARLAPAGLGSDTSGSVRVPAAHCGVVGFRPSMDCYSQSGIVPLAHTRDAAGSMARTVADIALLDQAITGIPNPRPATLAGLRLGVPRRHFYEQLDPQLEEIVEGALKRLRDLDVVLVEADLPDLSSAYKEIARAITAWEFPHDLAVYLRESGSALSVEDVVNAVVSTDVQPHVTAMLTPEPGTEATYRDAIDRQQPALRSAFEEYFKNHGIAAIVFPTVPLPAPPIGDDETVDHLGERVSIWIYLRNAVPASLTSGPGLSLPIGCTTNGLPVALELDAPANHEANIFSIAMAWEQSTEPIPPPSL